MLVGIEALRKMVGMDFVRWRRGLCSCADNGMEEDVMEREKYRFL
jgi:hypothetical protein